MRHGERSAGAKFNREIAVGHRPAVAVHQLERSADARLARAAAKGMMKRRAGRIIGITSIVGVTGNPGQTNYSASKAGVISLVQTTANELYGTGVRVNAICPGIIETGMTKPIFDGARARGTEGKIEAFIDLMRPYGIIELARTGRIALVRGNLGERAPK